MGNFDDPVSTEYFNPGDNLDRLLFFDVLEYRKDYPGFEQGDDDRDGVEVVVTVLDGEDAGTVYAASRLHQGKLVQALKTKVGGRVLGVLAKGEKKGKYQAPYIIIPASAEQKKVAEAYLSANSEPPF